MAKKEERVLLYQFPPEQLPAAQTVLRALGIRVQILPPDAWREKIGYLLGLKGYPGKTIDKGTYCPYGGGRAAHFL